MQCDVELTTRKLTLRKMKKIFRYLAVVLAGVALASCDDVVPVDFESDTNEIRIDAVGGKRRIQISSNDSWVASTKAPWITISPANGKGSTKCNIIIDSALYHTERYDEVLIENLTTKEWYTINITQEGFPYAIEIEEQEIGIDNYKKLDERKFKVSVLSNVDFTVEIPENVRWISNKRHNLDLNRGERPRRVDVEFEWDINTLPEERVADIKFVPKNQEITLSRQDGLKVTQKASEPIEENTRKGDSVALVSIQRTLETLVGWDVSIPMERWTGVILWNERHEGYTPDKRGRVKYAEFSLYNTKEVLPFQVKYLTAAEELVFFSNTNTFLKSLSVGDDITTLTQLKRLTIGAHGLVTLDESFKNLSNLEYLNLGSNNFMTVPEILTKENFPKLRTLILNANQRSLYNDLSLVTRGDLGGFIGEEKFPEHLLHWGLDTLNLSINYLQGALPTFEDDDTVPVYTEEDWAASNDTLPRMLVDRRIKKVMPKTKFFSINGNRLTGDLPEWLLYHPMLDWWLPYSLIFPQEGVDSKGTRASFSNEPVNLNYYYDIYTTKTKPDITIE